MKRLVWNLDRALRRFGRFGALGAVLFVAVAAAWTFVITPLAEEREARDTELQSLRTHYRLNKAKAAQRPATRSEQLSTFYASLPQTESLPDWLERLSKAASSAGIVLEKGEYVLALDSGGRIARYQIDLPVKAGYGQLRGFVAQVLHDVPASSLDDLSIRREVIGNDVLDARVRLTLYLSGSSP